MISARLFKLACYAAISEALYFSTAFFASSNLFEKFFSEVQPGNELSLNRLAFQRSLEFYTEYVRIRQEFKIFFLLLAALALLFKNFAMCRIQQSLEFYTGKLRRL